MLSLGGILAIGAAVVLVGLLVLFLRTIDDWSRDFTTNHAATADDAKNPALRPLEASLPPADMAEIVTAAAATLPNWELATRQDEAEAIELHFVRTTPLMRFKDDIRVRLVATPTGCRLTAESQSRVGKGDLGQNPRNLIELLDVVRARLK